MAKPRMVTVPKAEWDALVRYVRAEEQVYRDSYNTPGKNDWEKYFRENHPQDWEVFDAARRAAERKF